MFFVHIFAWTTWNKLCSETGWNQSISLYLTASSSQNDKVVSNQPRWIEFCKCLITICLHKGWNMCLSYISLGPSGAIWQQRNWLKTLPEWILTNHQWCLVAFTHCQRQFHRKQAGKLVLTCSPIRASHRYPIISKNRYDHTDTIIGIPPIVFRYVSIRKMHFHIHLPSFKITVFVMVGDS